MENLKIQIKFETDYREFAENSYMVWKNTREVLQLLWLRPLFSILIATFSAFPLWLVGTPLIICILNFLVVFTISILFFRSNYKKEFISKYLKVYGKEPFSVEVEIYEDRISCEFLKRKYIYDMDNLKEVKEYPEAIYLFIGDGFLIIVPKSAFETPQNMGQFLAFTKSRVKEIEN